MLVVYSLVLCWHCTDPCRELSGAERGQSAVWAVLMFAWKVELTDLRESEPSFGTASLSTGHKTDPEFKASLLCLCTYDVALLWTVTKLMKLAIALLWFGSLLSGLCAETAINKNKSATQRLLPMNHLSLINHKVSQTPNRSLSSN